jgi:hypothetical protein
MKTFMSDKELMQLTEQDALEITILLFQDLVEIKSFRKQSSKYFEKVKNYRGHCALCEVYKKIACGCCPLTHTNTNCDLYDEFCFNHDISAAEKIISLCKNKLRSTNENSKVMYGEAP